MFISKLLLQHRIKSLFNLVVWYAFGSLYLLGNFQILFGGFTCILFFKIKPISGQDSLTRPKKVYSLLD